MKLERKQGFYEKCVKRALDIICSLLFIILFCWLYAIIAIVIRIKMGSPVIFKQPRPGIVKNGKETIFDMYKFRSMTDERDSKVSKADYDTLQAKAIQILEERA